VLSPRRKNLRSVADTVESSRIVVHQQNRSCSREFFIFQWTVNQMDQDNCFRLLRNRSIQIRLLSTFQHQVYVDSRPLNFRTFENWVIHMQRDQERCQRFSNRQHTTFDSPVLEVAMYTMAEYPTRYRDRNHHFWANGIFPLRHTDLIRIQHQFGATTRYKLPGVLYCHIQKWSRNLKSGVFLRSINPLEKFSLSTSQQRNRSSAL
jgi:hypothetical protein